MSEITRADIELFNDRLMLLSELRLSYHNASGLFPPGEVFHRHAAHP
jgi:hypothetical protein